MSQQIDGIFSKYKKVFISDQEKIKKYLLTHYERALLTRQVINVERVDSTERIKISGFNKYLSSWRNFYQNIVVTSCVLINNVQKRYDYKFYFTKEKLDVTTIEKIERALEESARLRRNFKFEEAIAKIDEMLELIQKKKDEVTNKILNDARREIVAAQEKYDKNMIAISKLENKIKVAEDYDNLRDIPKNCENIIKLAESIGRNDLVKKYKGMKEDTQKEIGKRKAQEKQMALKDAKALAKRKEQESYDKAMAQIANLEEKIKIDRANGNLKAALIDCEKIINIANLIDKDDLIVKYSKLYESLGNELEAKEAREREMAIKSKESLKKQKAEQKRKALEAKEALKKQRAEQMRKALEAKETLKKQKALEAEEKHRALEAEEILKKQKALEAEEALKKQRAKEAKEKLEAEKTLKAQQENERKNKALEQIEVLEESFRAYQEADDLNGVVTDCLLIIKLADSIGEEDIAAKYTGILDDAVKELENRKAQEKVKALEEKEALKRQKEALKQQKALEKQKALEAKNTLKAQQSEEKKSKILEQIAALEDSIRAYQEAENLNGVVSDCQQIIKLANSIGEEDIAEKYREILDNALKELENQKAQEKVKAQEAKKAQKEAKDQEKYDKVLDQISKLEDNMNTNHANGNLSAALNDCKDILNLASRIGREYLVDKYSGILDELQKELEASEAIEMEKDLDDKWEESKIEGEYLFLIKDLILARIPNVDIVKLVREKEGNLFAKYKKELDDFFDNYDPNLQTTEETAELAALLLKPDIYDFLSLMRNNFYPLDKIPKILSEWADSDKILNELLDLNILTVIKASKKRKWLILLTDIKPLIVFPEHTFPNIRVAYKAKKITYEVAKKALDLMEVTFVEKLIF